MMHINSDALQTQISADDATDATDASDTIPTTQLNDDTNLNPIQATNSTETTELNSDSSSLPAIAEDLINGCSQNTEVENELDAEMVSEDELPAPEQPKVDNAEDLSDEELPGPKRAELPADTEVVSEDEFPSSNKMKRKIGENNEPDNSTENAETPKKRAKAEPESKSIALKKKKLSKCVQ